MRSIVEVVLRLARRALHRSEEDFFTSRLRLAAAQVLAERLGQALCALLVCFAHRVPISCAMEREQLALTLCGPLAIAPPSASVLPIGPEQAMLP